MHSLAALASLAAFGALSTSVDAHASVTEPRQRGSGTWCSHCVGITNSLPSNPGCPECIPGTIPYRNGPCGGGLNSPGKAENHDYPYPEFGYEPTHSYVEGDIIQIGFYWNAPHGGWHQFRICPNATMNSWFTTPDYEPSQSQMDQIEQCFAANPLDMSVSGCDTLGKEHGWCWLPDGASPTTFSAKLPQGYVTEHGLLHWRWDAWKSANEIYNQCSDISVTRNNGSPPPTPTSAPPSPTSAPPSPTSVPPSPTAAPPPPGPCQPHYQQCGGINWSGSTTCCDGRTCQLINDYYFQCL